MIPSHAKIRPTPHPHSNGTLVTMASRVLLVLAVVLSVSAIATATRPMEDGRVSTPPNDWRDVGAADSAEPIRLIFAVKNAEGSERMLEELLLRVSDPSDAENYGKHLSMEQANRVVAPHPTAVAEVTEYLELAAGAAAVERSPTGDWITVDTTVGVAEAVLGAPLRRFHHAGSRVTVTRVAGGHGYTLPSAIAHHVDFVEPSIRFTRMKKPTLPAAQLKEWHEEVRRMAKVGNGSFINDPTFLRALYQLPDAYGKAPDNLQCVCSFIGQFYSDADLQEFFGLFFNSSHGQTPKQIGNNDPNNVGMEASLDVQYLMSVGADIPSEVWYTAGQNTPFMNWIVNVSSAKSLPHIFSFSYGDYENGISAAYANRINTELAKLGARGTSLLVASGDSGVGGNCSADGRFSPDFPASSPWVTAVGGLVGGDAGKTPTGEYTDMISGGGFSDYFPRPAYQDAAVEKFFATNKSLPNPQYYNASGAGYPDIAAQSEMFVIVFDRIPLPGVGGTSCATPTSAGVFSQLNDLRLQAGKPPLGFLNPLIYQTAPNHPNSFNDVTGGANAGCDQFTGFTAVPGWDAATGWGSPNFRILSSIVADLP